MCPTESLGTCDYKDDRFATLDHVGGLHRQQEKCVNWQPIPTPSPTPEEPTPTTPMVKITVRVPLDIAHELSTFPGNTSEVAREALVLGLRKMGKQARKRRRKAI